MRSLLIILSFVYSLNSFAWFNVQANCWLNGGTNAVCEACNNTYQPLYCEMQVQGVTNASYWFDGFQNGYVYSGQCIRGVVYANNPYVDPLVNARAVVRCRF
ncbi:MAG: hypothetical protein K9K67_08040 [Bacteriovoracaceae bacterium]|nr:hypothetical protein [Bacteriovoracaceae bacterium]